MLPFLKHKQEGSISAPVETVERKSDHEEEYDGLESAAEDLIQAMNEGNAKAVASALRAAFELCDSQPHEDGPHV